MYRVYPLSVAQLTPEETGLLHPAYWGNGNTIGRGNIQTPDPTRMSASRLKRASLSLLMSQALQPGMTLQTYRSGDEFDAADHPHGTIVKLDKEELVTTLPYEALNPDDFAGSSPHVHEPQQDYTEIIITEHLNYTNGGLLAIVDHGPLRRRQPRLVQVARVVGPVIANEAGFKFEARLGFEPAPPVVRVGETTHYRLPQSGCEIFERTRQLHILHPGTADPKTRRSWLPHGPLRPRTA